MEARADHRCTEIPPWERRDTALLATLALVFLATRLAWIASNPETASYWEESYRWLAAHEILGGSTRSLFDYQADHYQGGSLFVILLAQPFFSLGGESVFTLKLGALLFSVGTLTSLFVLGRCFFGRLVGLFAGLAYLAGPPLVAFWGVVLMGFHSESTFLSLLQVSVFLGLLTGAWRRPAGWVSFGLVCGAGFSFTYITALSAAACVLAWLLLEPPPRWKELGLAAVGCGAGLLPWIAYNASHDFAGLMRIAEVFGAREAADLWRAQGFGERLVELLVRVPVRGLLDPSENALPFPWRTIVAVGFLVPASLALVAAALRMGRFLRSGLRWGIGSTDELARRELVFGLYGALFAFAYLASRFTLDPVPKAIAYRLFPPLVVLLMIPVASSAQRMIAAGGGLRRAARVAAVVCLVSMGTATLAFAMGPPDRGAVLSLNQGYSVYGRLLHRKHSELPDALAAARHVIDPEGRKRVISGIGWEVQQRFERGGDFEDLMRRLRAVPQAERAAVLGGVLWGAEDRISVLTERADLDARDLDTIERMRELARVVAAELEAEDGPPPPGPRRDRRGARGRRGGLPERHGAH
ncbi:glycosyltransferase family 39 protein [bacterium]|nr:glycosyltransferase family 39 protein [bacterium]